MRGQDGEAKERRTRCQEGNRYEGGLGPSESSADEEMRENDRWWHCDTHPYLEEGEANIVFEDDAPYAPHVTRLGPAQLWGGDAVGGKRH